MGDRSWKEWSFIFTMIGCVQSLLLTTLAMFFYAGGNSENPSSPGFSFWNNALSDLGRLTAYSGADNQVSSILFCSSLFLMGLLIIPYFIVMPILITEGRSIRWLCIIGSLFGLVLGISMIGGSFTPPDLYWETHVGFGALGFVTGLPAAITYSTALFLDSYYPNRYSIVFLVLALIEFAFLIILFQHLGTGGIMIAFATGQKFVVYGMTLCYLVQAHGARKILVVRSKKDHIPA